MKPVRMRAGASRARSLARLACLFPVVTASCSSSGAVDDAGRRDASAQDAGVPSFSSMDAAYDVPLVVAVKGTIDQICSSTDGCHGTSNQGHLLLSVGNEFPPLINVPSFEEPSLLRVDPGYPDRSYVYLKLACEGGIEGGCMPLGSGGIPKLSRIFHDWIEAGAPTD
jgi:hypothetical protein